MEGEDGVCRSRMELFIMSVKHRERCAEAEGGGGAPEARRPIAGCLCVGMEGIYAFKWVTLWRDLKQAHHIPTHL